ncbi:MAG: nitrite reductase (NADH) large subunit [Candidatus Pseudothioglobus sp.]|jgi:nitrite reductase (NADH) large subunit
MLKVVVVGNGMVGHHYVDKLVSSQTQAEITVIGGETRPAYDRVHLSEYFSGRTAQDLALTTVEKYEEMGVTAHFGDPVRSIDRAAKTVQTSSGEVHAYDKLVLATGSYPFVPPIPGSELDACMVYRTLDDLGNIERQSKGAKVGVVVGGGLLGLEAANAVMNLGMETHVVEFAPGLMGVQLDIGGSAMLRRKIEALGVIVHTSKATQLIEETCSEEATKDELPRLLMKFADGSTLATDVIVFSAGIRPYDQLGKAAELTVGERGGIETNEYCQTSDPDIYAIGECALYAGRIYGLVAPGYRMAEVAVSQLGDAASTFQGADMSTKLKLLGVDVGSIGDAHALQAGAIAYTFSDERIDVYKRIIVSEDGKQLLGAVLVGDCSAYDTLLQYFLNGIVLPADPEVLILPYNAGEAPTLGSGALPSSATICSCHNVSKGEIVSIIDAGFYSLGDVKSQTAASTGCGGCSALLKSLVDDELAARGLEVNTAICEHFNHTRQELFHIVKIEAITSFNALIAGHGTGRGCDICKPTVGSILASLWNEHVLGDQNVGLQDTNDTFLANMQKNGTYSVVPRIAGGEITPDRLIALGQVAKKYNLYTKITGGQRIDLFGARVQQLPDIWQELVDAGFETGHAYGKALRTVKSCVGSTWCRYGVQDSVGMALYVENRYKGLRSPHKLKGGVSGCARECAEAQSKDFGIIATEKGWNLYVGGNGGMKPRHADLFATDLDDETLIRYIDRFLMFYVQTADRLQRTSVWLSNLDGGLAYLQQVVIEDSLGIGAELEKQMSHIVGTYQCEWKSTIEDPEKLKRFRQFVNSDDEDEQIVFVQERGQPRPATEAEKIQLQKISA